MIPDVTVRVRPAAARAPLRGLDRGELRGRCRDRPRARPGPGPARRDPRLRRGGDAGSRWRSRARAASPAALFGGYLGLRRRARRLPDRSSASRATRSRSPGAARWRSARCARGGAAYLGQAAGRSWEHGRYQGPYLRDTLMEMGAMVETLETSHTWIAAGRAARGGRRARSATRSPARARPGLVFCHLSHAYADGASLYFTFISRAPPRRRDRAVAAGQAGRLRGDRRQRRHDHPPPRGRPRPRPLHGGRGGADRARRRCGAVKERARPGRDHEPRQAAARLTWRCASLRPWPAWPRQPGTISGLCGRLYRGAGDRPAEHVFAGVAGQALLLFRRLRSRLRRRRPRSARRRSGRRRRRRRRRAVRSGPGTGRRSRPLADVDRADPQRELRRP